MNIRVIEGGMGVGISDWRLARTIGRCSDVLPTVTGVASWIVVPRILQKGDPGGHFRRALAQFPFQSVAERIVEKYFVEGGISVSQKFKVVPVFHLSPSQEVIELAVASTFAIVWLAKVGHSSPVSINLLEKMQCPILAQLFGAMLAGVDVVTMGAGIPMMVPGVLDAYARGEPALYHVAVEGSTLGYTEVHFDPKRYFGDKLPQLRRPLFLPIVSSYVLAAAMNKRLGDGIFGFVVEKECAGGHNAPPRGQLVLNKLGEPVYGPRDAVDFEKIRQLGRPFWIGGGLASPESLQDALSLGASGIQVGSIFALCDESGMLPLIRAVIRQLGYRGELEVRSDPVASPTGFPFQVVQLPDTLSDPSVYAGRRRVCDLCALATPFQRSDGTIAFRCRAQPVENFLYHGGSQEDSVGARCLCNGLTATAGLSNSDEPPIVTLGKDVGFLRHLMSCDSGTYTAHDVVRYLLSS